MNTPFSPHRLPLHTFEQGTKQWPWHWKTISHFKNVSSRFWLFRYKSNLSHIFQGTSFIVSLPFLHLYRVYLVEWLWDLNYIDMWIVYCNAWHVFTLNKFYNRCSMSVNDRKEEPGLGRLYYLDPQWLSKFPKLSWIMFTSFCLREASFKAVVYF